MGFLSSAKSIFSRVFDGAPKQSTSVAPPRRPKVERKAPLDSRYRSVTAAPSGRATKYEKLPVDHKVGKHWGSFVKWGDSPTEQKDSPVRAVSFNKETGEKRFAADPRHKTPDKNPGGYEMWEIASDSGKNPGEAAYDSLKTSEFIKDINQGIISKVRTAPAQWLFEKFGDHEKEKAAAAEAGEEFSAEGLEPETGYIAPDGSRFTEDQMIAYFKLKDGSIVERRQLEKSGNDENNTKLKTRSGQIFPQSEVRERKSLDGKTIKMRNVYNEEVVIPVDELNEAKRNKTFVLEYEPFVFINTSDMYNSEAEWEDALHELRTPDGKTVVMRADGTLPEEDRGKVATYQAESRGPFNMGVIDPREPWLDKAGNLVGSENYNWKNSAITEVFPWVTDAFLDSFPYFVPRYNAATVYAEASPYMNGVDGDTYDTGEKLFDGVGTYGDPSELTNIGRAAGIASPLFDMWIEKLGFDAALEKLGLKFAGSAAGKVASDAMKKSTKMIGARNFLGKGLPTAVLSSGVVEGAEEFPSLFVSKLKEDGLANYGLPKTYNAETREWDYDQDGSRAKELLSSALQQSAAGGLVGGAVEFNRGMIGGGKRSLDKTIRRWSGKPPRVSIPQMDQEIYAPYEPPIAQPSRRNLVEE